jgi:predicted transcriptional regulator
MSQILVWKCDQTGKLFEDKNKYRGHLSKLARERNTKRRLMVQEAIADQKWAELYECEQTIEQWRDMVIANQNMFWAEAARGDKHDWDNVGKTRSRKAGAVVCPIPELLEFTEFNVRWNPEVSNSHSAPHNGVQCWSSQEAKDGRPRSYPGWSGRLEWIVRWPKEWDGVYLGGDLFNSGTFRSGRQRAHTGTGGGGGMRYSEKHKCWVQSFGYEFRIYAADWPGMARYLAKQQFVEVLQGRRESIAWAE